MLRNVSILGQQYAYVMYYAGAKLYSDFQAKIGIAVSTNGKSWTRLGSIPIDLNCNAAPSDQYGCLHLTVVKLSGDRFVGLYVKDTGAWDDGTYNVESWDGFHWTGPNSFAPQRLCFASKFGGCSAQPAPDMTYDPTLGYYLLTFTASVNEGGMQKRYEWLLRVDQTWFGTIDYTKTVSVELGKYLYTAISPDGSTTIPGFYREGNGYRFTHWTPNPVWTSTQDRPLESWPAFDPELIQICWGTQAQCAN